MTVQEQEQEQEQDTGQETFSRAYVEKLRSESAKYRTKLRDLEAVWEPYTVPEREYLQRLIRGLAEEGEARQDAARELARMSSHLLGEQTQQPQPQQKQEGPVTTEPKTEVPEDDDRPLTRKEFLELMQIQQQQSAEDEQVQAVLRELTELGLQQGTPAFLTALHLAANDPDINGDLKLAAERAQVLYPPAKAGTEAETETEGEGEGEEKRVFPVTADAGGAGAQPEPPVAGPESWDEARERLERRLERA